MIIPFGSLTAAYEEIKEQAKNQACTVAIFVSPECDSLCALHILITLLKSDNLKYQFDCITGYDNLREYAHLLTDTEIRSVVMINCGATVDLRDFLHLSEQTKVYIIDSHRPYNLNNVRKTNDQVRILDDTDKEEEYPPDKIDYDDEDDEAEIEQEDEDGKVVKKRRTLDDVAERAQKRAEIRKQNLQIDEKVNAYYQYSYYGSAASILMYEIAMTLQKESNELLWMRIVGFTDQLIQERLTMDKYNVTVAHTSERVETLNTIESDEKYDSKESLLEKDELVSKPRSGEIKLSEEFRLMVLRHWTLYDSLYHSPYVVSRLKCYEEGGKKRLKEFLTKLGLPLTECKTSFKFMGEKFKSMWKESAPEIAKRFGLPEISYKSFSREQGSNFRISASDMVYSIQALLETPYTEEKGWKTNFSRAYGALKSKDLKVLHAGLDRSIEIQKIIMRQGKMMLSKAQRHKAFTSTGDFRYAVIKEGNDLESLSHPIALVKLALFLQEGWQHLSKKLQPLVLCALMEKKNAYLVVGVVPNVVRSSLTGEITSYTGGSKNWFGNRFRQAADDCKARFSHDSFETAILEVVGDDLVKFLRVLHYAS